MEASSRTDQIVRFGAYEIDRRACELRRAGQRIPLQIQPFRVLEALIDRAGEVVTRADLRAKIWPSTVYVDFDHGLNNAMNRLRRALEDSADAPRFIETLPRVGYRFIHTVEQCEAGPRPPPAARARHAVGLRVGIAAAAVLRNCRGWHRRCALGRGRKRGQSPNRSREPANGERRGV